MQKTAKKKSEDGMWKSSNSKSNLRQKSSDDFIIPNAPKNSKKLMQVIINSKPHTTEATHLAQLIEELGLPAIGTAAAVNNKMVPRTQWAETALTPDLPITIIRAACGG